MIGPAKVTQKIHIPGIVHHTQITFPTTLEERCYSCLQCTEEELTQDSSETLSKVGSQQIETGSKPKEDAKSRAHIFNHYFTPPSKSFSWNYTEQVNKEMGPKDAELPSQHRDTDQPWSESSCLPGYAHCRVLPPFKQPHQYFSRKQKIGKTEDTVTEQT